MRGVQRYAEVCRGMQECDVQQDKYTVFLLYKHKGMYMYSYFVLLDYSFFIIHACGGLDH